MASRSIWSATLAGAVIGMLAAAIVLLVPVIGIRKEFDHLVLYWQELALYVSCIAVSAVAGARYRYRAAKHYQQFLDGGPEAEEESAPEIIPNSIPSMVPELVAEPTMMRDDSSQVGVDRSSTSEPEAKSYSQPPLGSTAEPELTEGEVLKKSLDGASRTLGQQLDSKPNVVVDEVLTEPPIEESLAGGPKKRRFRLWSEESKIRTIVLAMLLYLVLFVKCAVLCQRLRLGVIILDPVSEELLRSFGLGVTVAGLYIAIRGLFVDSNIGLPVSDESPDMVPKSNSHVPPTRFSFLRQHPVCTGWLVILSGLPLVYQAWFPLLAIPGIFVAMNWLFPSRKLA